MFPHLKIIIFTNKRENPAIAQLLDFIKPKTWLIIRQTNNFCYTKNNKKIANLTNFAFKLPKSFILKYCRALLDFANFFNVSLTEYLTPFHRISHTLFKFWVAYFLILHKQLMKYFRLQPGFFFGEEGCSLMVR